MTDTAADRVRFGPSLEGCALIIALTFAVTLVVPAVLIPTTHSNVLTLLVWAVVWAACFVPALRTSGTVVDSAGLHWRQLWRTRSLPWSDVAAGVWGEFQLIKVQPSRPDVRVYAMPRSTPLNYLPIASVPPAGLEDPKTAYGRRNRRLLIDAVHLLQAHDVPVYAENRSLFATMTELGLDAANETTSDEPQANSDLPHQSPGPESPGGQA